MTDDVTIRLNTTDVRPVVTGDEPDEDRTLRADSVASFHPLNTREFILHGVTYSYVRSLSDSSGEAQVFLVSRDDKEYVLKVYYPNIDIRRDTLKIVANLDFDMIVRVYDYGRVYVDGKNRSYELMEYLRGGTLNHCSLNGDINAFRRIALQAAAALACCHNNNIIHKDIKPGNFFFRDVEQKEVVLGDFGISSVIADNCHLHRTTQARTPLYAAPEMYNDVIDGEVEISTAADYYSLGIMLMTLWMGKSMMNANERIIMRRKSEGRLPGVNELPERVRIIVQGLTAVNPETRWTYEEVEQWFLGESPKVDIASPYLKYKSFVVDPERNIVADNVHELVPMLVDNERIACGYLYGGTITEWLEKCGNTKLSVIVDDIVKNRYPADQTAGLMVTAYTMDPAFPYKDIKGDLCDDVHSVAISLMSYADEYAVILVNHNDRLWLYLETHLRVDINRMRSYFVRDNDKDNRKAVMRMVYEIDPDAPFFSRYQSATLPEIVGCFGRNDMTEDEWRSITDGRLLSWMYSHVDNMACESLRIMTENQPYSRLLAYKVLYNLDRKAAYDLLDIDTPQKVGERLAEQLVEWQHASDEDLAERMAEYSSPDGRFQYFAHLHGWFEQLSEAQRCFDLTSEENRDRLGAYDLRTAAYRFCRILGVTPQYALSCGARLDDGHDIDNRYRSEIRSEIRSGCFRQWLSVFYHENPCHDFIEPYSYERMLEQWVNLLGDFDAHQPYSKRFVTAKDETARRYAEVRSSYDRAKMRENLWRMLFYGLCSVWILLVVLFGVSGRDYLLGHSFMTIGIPVGGVSALIVGLRAFFRGYGFLLSALWGLLGAVTSLIPVWILRFVNAQCPSLFVVVVIALTLIYMGVCHYTDFKGESKEDKKLISEVLDDDINSTLIEPLYYTFKTKSYRFKGSKFGLFDDVQNRINTVAGERVLHYMLWSLMVFLLVLEMIIYSPSLMNVPNPGTDKRNASSEHIEKTSGNEFLE